MLGQLYHCLQTGQTYDPAPARHHMGAQACGPLLRLARAAPPAEPRMLTGRAGKSCRLQRQSAVGSRFSGSRKDLEGERMQDAQEAGQELPWDSDDDDLETAAQIDEYDLTSSPNDFNVLTIQQFIESGAVKIPAFQRNYAPHPPNEL
jgi:hypothetical protein